MSENETPGQSPGQEPEQPTSPLRGSLQDNATDSDLHSMGGDIGPASMATSAGDEPARGDAAAEEVGGTTSTPASGATGGQGDGDVASAMAVSSDVTTHIRDDADDPGGGDAGPTPVAGAGSNYVASDEPVAGRGADGDTRAREQAHHDGSGAQ